MKSWNRSDLRGPGSTLWSQRRRICEWQVGISVPATVLRLPFVFKQQLSSSPQQPKAFSGLLLWRCQMSRLRLLERPTHAENAELLPSFRPVHLAAGLACRPNKGRQLTVRLANYCLT